MVDVVDYRRKPLARTTARSRTRITFSKDESKDLLKSWLVLSIAYLFTYGTIIFYFPEVILFILPYITISTGLTFIVHELAHKFVAQRHGLEAHYKSNDYLLALSLMISLSGFLFFTAGAVVIKGDYLDDREIGHIAAAGPISNLIIAGIFLPLSFIFPEIFFFKYLFGINAWIGFYNMLPVGILDGLKIARWSKLAFWLIITTAIVLVVVDLFPYYANRIYFHYP
nr:M50 family metallopeptidase [Candidatus Sigynarchaeota archaeon]